MIPLHDKAHVSEALGLLTSMFADKANITGLLAAFVKPVQDVEDAIFAYLDGIPLEEGAGDLLNKYGRIVGLPRDGLSDADYLQQIKIKIRVNRSRGLAEDIIQISALLSPGCTYYEAYPAAFEVTVFDTTSAIASALLKYLAKARAAGVHGVLAFSTWSAPTLAWDDTGGGAVTPAWGDDGGTPGTDYLLPAEMAL